MKKCTNCKQEKTLESFYKDSSRADGREFICKDCRKQKRKKIEENRNQEELKKCGNCKETKKFKEFYAGRPECKECTKSNRNKRYKENPEKQKELSRKHRIKNRDACNEYLRLWRKENKEYEKMYNKKRFKENRDERLRDSKKYYEKNKEKIQEYLKLYRQKNKEELNIKRRDYVKKRHKEKPITKVKKRLRSRTSAAFRAKKWSKRSSYKEFLGCEYDTAMKHIESQFTEGMNWDNHGLYGWHIDHIIPLSLAKNIKELEELCRYTNLQPLWAEDNLRKGNKKEGE